jgi:uncharacterized protein YqgC (DUF456 family)
MDSQTAAVVVVAIVMAVGLAGTILPFVPGLPLIWAGALGYGLVEGFGTTGWVSMVVITLAMAAGIVAKLVLPQKRATASGVPSSTLAVAGLGGLIGFFVIPVVGLPLGAVAGVFLAEYFRTKETHAAWRSTKTVVVGFGLGVLLEMTAGVVMIACWVAWVLLGT